MAVFIDETRVFANGEFEIYDLSKYAKPGEVARIDVMSDDLYNDDALPPVGQQYFIQYYPWPDNAGVAINNLQFVMDARCKLMLSLPVLGQPNEKLEFVCASLVGMTARIRLSIASQAHQLINAAISYPLRLGKADGAKQVFRVQGLEDASARVRAYAVYGGGGSFTMSMGRYAKDGAAFGAQTIYTAAASPATADVETFLGADSAFLINTTSVSVLALNAVVREDY